jgi:predicted CoA-substrate-specific enzyme activase
MFAGVDAGSRAIKIVLLGTEGRIAARGQVDQAVRQGELAESLYEALLDEAGAARKDVAGVVATGYARQGVTFATRTVTEITCHARGVHHLLPEARCVVEVGGQDSKLLHLEADGAVRDFSMNDRCAAGTGRFLEMLAARLEVPLADLGALASQSQAAAPISSMCVVFAETEIIGLLAAGRSCPDIVAGVQSAIAARVAAMAGRTLAGPVVFTGGVALVGGMAGAMETTLKCAVTIAPDPQFTGALGAAILARAAARRAEGGKP